MDLITCKIMVNVSEEKIYWVSFSVGWFKRMNSELSILNVTSIPTLSMGFILLFLLNFYLFVIIAELEIGVPASIEGSHDSFPLVRMRKS